MGIGDTLKGLRDQAQHAVHENRDKIHGAVHSVGEAANKGTKGKYADKITKMGDAVHSGVDKIAVPPDHAGGPAGPPAENASGENGAAEASAQPESAEAESAETQTPADAPEFE